MPIANHRLDYTQTLKNAYDININRIRVDAEVQASFGDLEVSLLSTEDSIAIGNTAGTNFLAINPDGSLNIVVVSSALPIGAATEAKQDVGNASLASIDSKLTTTNSILTDIEGGIPEALGQTTMANSMPVVIASDQSPIPVSGTGDFTVVQPIGTNLHTVVDSGSITVNNGAGAAAVNIQDGGNSITVDGTLAVTQSGTWNITDITGTISLPTGASTSALQTTINNSIQALQVTQGSTTSGQSGTLIQGAVTTVAPTYITGQTSPLSLTTSGALRVDGSGVTQPISGTITALQGTSPWVVSGTVAATQSGTWVLGSNSGVDIGDVTVNNGPGAAAVNIQDGGNSITVDAIDLDIRDLDATQDNVAISDGTDVLAINADGSINITDNGGSLTVDGTVTVLQGTSPWVVTGAVTTSPDVNVHDGTGVSISSTGSSLNVNITNTVPVSQSGTWNINNITGTISLPTGASTSALQIAGNASLASIDSKIVLDYGTSTQAIRTAAQIGNTTGQADFNAGTTTAQTLRVVLPTDQTAIPVTQSGAWTTGRTWVLSSGTDSVAAVQSGTWVLGANSGIDIGDVTVNNGAGAAAVNIQDGGNSITVDGTVTVLQGTSPWIVSGAVTLPYDTNYGTVGANTLRTASQIGNATGAADFGAGTTTAQTLRVVLPTDQTAIPVTQSTSPWVVSGTVTSNIGTTGGLALDTTVAGLLTDAQLRATPVPISGTVAVSNFPAYDTNYGTVGANTLRTASQIGNATGAANFNIGATGAQTLRTTSNLSDGAGTALTSTIFNSKQSLDVRTNDGFSTASNTRVGVTNASTQLLAANLNRRYVYIFNQSGSIIFIKLGAAAVMNQGIRLPNNEMYELTLDKLWTGTINAITNAGTQTVDIFEGT